MSPVDFPLAGKRIAIAGPRGMVGSALMRRLATIDCEALPLGRAEADLTNQAASFAWLERHRPDVLVIAAAEVGGILANSTWPATFLYNNLAIEANLIEGARRAGVAKLLLLGSTCIYPKFAPQPIAEESLLTGPLEPTNEWYAIAKIAGLKMCQAYRRQYGFNAISAMPTNLYGPGDNFSLKNSHVLPALLRKVHEAKEAGAAQVEVWGTGKPRREFLHVDDLADACLFLMQNYDGDGWVNVGWGRDETIAELAQTISRVVGFAGALRFDTSKPDGTPRKLLDTSKLTALGWKPKIELEAGIRSTYEWFLSHQDSLKI